MAYEFDLQLMSGYVRAEVSGARRFGDAAFEAGIVGRKIVEFCRDADVYRVMVVLKLKGALSPIDSHEMVVSSESYGWTHDFRLALVDSDEESLADVQFTETVAINRAYSVRAFRTEDDALAWLLTEDSSCASISE